MINSQSGCYHVNGSNKNEKGYRILEIIPPLRTHNMSRDMLFMVLNIDTQTILFFGHQVFNGAKFIADEDLPYTSRD